ncbi:MAG: hypothetical protein ACI9VR_004637 [Cognaticolwellia sp.]|jgi:hypothetical protein
MESEMLLVLGLIACASSPPEMLRSTATSDEGTNSTYLAYVDRDFVVDAVGEAEVLACEAALVPGPQACRVNLGLCVDVFIIQDGPYMMIVQPIKCGGAAMIMPGKARPES